MLNIIPSDLSTLTQGESRVVNKLKEIYKDVSRDIFLYVKPRLRNLEPDFILIDPLKGVSVLEIKDWSLDFIKTINRVEVVTANNKTLHNPAFRTNQYFNIAKSLFEADPRLVNQDSGKLEFSFFAKVILINISSEEISSRQGLSEVLVQYPTEIISSEIYKNSQTNTFFDNTSSNLSNPQIQVVRKILFPEIEIFDSLKDSTNESIIELADISQTIKALDVRQEQFAKKVPNGHYMISGVPGSGKTVILLSRALFLVKEHPDWKVKIVTYNRSLSRNLEKRLNRLKSSLDFALIPYSNIEISTFSKMAKDVANIAIPDNASDNFWKEELPLLALQKATPTYDALLIDEYQDFYDSWIRLCLAVCKKYEYNGELIENLFLAGDKVQSIYNPNIDTSWVNLGVHIVGKGKSEILKLAYRSGKSHIKLALDFLATDQVLAGIVSKFYESRESIQSSENTSDKVGLVEGEFSSVITILEQLISRIGYKPEEILILAPTHRIRNEFYQSLPNHLRDICEVTKDWIEGKVNIVTIHSAKGLESRICIMLSLDHYQIARAKRQDMLLIYVGMTRAFQELYIHAYSFATDTLAKRIKDILSV